MPDQPSPSKLVDLLRRRLSRTDIRDYAAEYGEETEGTFNLYDRLIGQVGLDDAISALVAYAVQRNNVHVLVRIIHDKRPDLRADLAAVPHMEIQQAKEQLQPVNACGGANITGNVTNSGGVNIYGGQVANITYIVQEKDNPPHP